MVLGRPIGVGPLWLDESLGRERLEQIRLDVGQGFAAGVGAAHQPAGEGGGGSRGAGDQIARVLISDDARARGDRSDEIAAVGVGGQAVAAAGGDGDHLGIGCGICREIGRAHV
jgi:hypothetical protein